MTPFYRHPPCRRSHPPRPVCCHSRARQQLALDALAGQSISALADRHQVSRKFVYQQLGHAHDALDQSVLAPPRPNRRSSSSGCPSPNPGFAATGPRPHPHLPQFLSAASTNCSPTFLDYPFGRWGRSTTSCTRPSPTHASTTPNKTSPRCASATTTRSSRPADRFSSASTSLRPTATSSVLKNIATPTPWGVRLLELSEVARASIPTPPSPISPGASCVPAKLKPRPDVRSCRGDVFHALQTATPLVRYLSRTAPTTPSPPAAGSRRPPGLAPEHRSGTARMPP